MTPCCEQVIAGYTALLSAYTESGPREGTALFCPESESRLVYRQGEWMEESRGIDIPGGPVSAEIPESQPPVSDGLVGENYDEGLPPSGMVREEDNESDRGWAG